MVSDEYFGELSLIDGEPRAATVSAAGPVTVAASTAKTSARCWPTSRRWRPASSPASP